MAAFAAMTVREACANGLMHPTNRIPRRTHFHPDGGGDLRQLVCAITSKDRSSLQASMRPSAVRFSGQRDAAHEGWREWRPSPP